jgi:hypothetical protein
MELKIQIVKNKLRILVNEPNALLKESGFFNLLSDSNYSFMLMFNLESSLKAFFKKNKDTLIQNMAIMDCMSGNLLSTLQNHSDSIISGLQLTGFLGISAWGLLTIYNKWSGSKGKGNDNSGESTADTTNNIANSDSSKLENPNSVGEVANNNDSSIISSENSNFVVDNTENIIRNDEGIIGNDSGGEELLWGVEREFNSFESLDPFNFLGTLRDMVLHLESQGAIVSGNDLAILAYKCLNTEDCGDMSKLLENFDIQEAVEYFSNRPGVYSGYYSEHVINLINMEGAVEYFSLFRLSEGNPEIKAILLATAALTLYEILKETNNKFPKDFDRKYYIAVEDFNFFSGFYIQDYFRLFKESFLHIIFDNIIEDQDPIYCPRKAGLRIIEEVIFNKTNMELFRSHYKESINKKDADNLHSVSSAYWLDRNHSIFNALNVNRRFFGHPSIISTLYEPLLTYWPHWMGAIEEDFPNYTENTNLAMTFSFIFARCQKISYQRICDDTDPNNKVNLNSSEQKNTNSIDGAGKNNESL